MILETDRLIIRPFVIDDLPVVHRILDQTRPDSWSKVEEEERRSWLQWQVLNYKWFSRLRQPPYSDRGITLKTSNQVVGSIGYVPLLMPFEQIPEFGPATQHGEYYTTEFGLVLGN